MDITLRSIKRCNEDTQNVVVTVSKDGSFYKFQYIVTEIYDGFFLKPRVIDRQIEITPILPNGYSCLSREEKFEIKHFIIECLEWEAKNNNKRLETLSQSGE